MNTEMDFYACEDADRALAWHAAVYCGLYGRQRIAQTMALLGGLDLENAVILDVGPGAGIWSAFLAGRFPGAKVHLLDKNPNLLKVSEQNMWRLAQATPAGQWRGTAQDAGLPSGAFDFVFCKDVVEHVLDDLAFMVALRRTLRTGGHLLLSTQNSWSLVNMLQGGWHRLFGKRKWLGWDETHLRFYNPLSLRRILRRSGFRPESYAGAHHIPFRLLSRLRTASAVGEGVTGESEAFCDLPIFDNPIATLSLARKTAAFVEFLGLTKLPPFSLCGWSLGVLAQAV